MWQQVGVMGVKIFSLIAMLKPSLSAVLVSIASMLGLVACGNEQPGPLRNNRAVSSTATVSSPSPVPSPVPAVTPLKTPGRDYYQRALDKAYSAASIGQSARTREDWQLAATQWERAIALLQAIPEDSPQQAIAQTKLEQYRNNLADARQQAQTPTSPQPPRSIPKLRNTAISPPDASVQRVFQARIKRRIGGTPVIDVRFNNEQTFEMIVDTGASGVVITQRMARSLGVEPIGVALADTASDKDVTFYIGTVEAIAVGDAVVRDLRVAIAPQLDIGLLGNQFFRNYDLTIRQDRIEFHSR